jgi:uncharacterized membrane protein YdjX (TVP38/TMEM64 family)
LSTPLVWLIAKVTAPLQDMGVWGWILFAVVFAVAATLMVPSSLMKLTAGAMFGFTGGLVAGWLGAWLGAMIPFAIVRWIGPDRARAWIDARPRWRAIDAVAEEEGLPLTVLIRLSLVIPYNITNWVIGATRIRTRDYALGNLATVVPTILYAWWGSQLGDVLAVLRGEGPAQDSLWWSTIAASLLLTLIGIIWMDREVRRRLDVILATTEEE